MNGDDDSRFMDLDEVLAEAAIDHTELGRLMQQGKLPEPASKWEWRDGQWHPRPRWSRVVLHQRLALMRLNMAMHQRDAAVPPPPNPQEH
jgi:hypothetical protein